MRKETISPAQRARRAAALESFELNQVIGEMRPLFMHRAPHELPYLTKSDWPDVSRIRKFQDEIMGVKNGD